MSDDRPKKSWREIDRGKDRSRQRFDPDARRKEVVEKSQAYSKYKANLDKLFTPGGAALPATLREKLGPPSDADNQKRELTDALKDKADAETLQAFLDAGLTLPQDGRLLIRLLDVDRPPLLEPVLQSLLELVEGGQKPSRMLLLQKLDALKLRYGDGPIAELSQLVRSALD